MVHILASFFLLFGSVFSSRCPISVPWVFFSLVPREKKFPRDRKMDTGRKKPPSEQKNESKKDHFSSLDTKLVISSRVEKSGPFRTRFSVQREVFSSPCPFFAPGRFFSHEERGRKIRQGSEMDTGRKKHSRRTEKKSTKSRPTFETRGRKCFIL